MKLEEIEDVAKDWPLSAKQAKDFLTRLAQLKHTSDDLNKLSLAIVYMPKLLAVARAAAFILENSYIDRGSYDLKIALQALEKE